MMLYEQNHEGVPAVGDSLSAKERGHPAMAALQMHGRNKRKTLAAGKPLALCSRYTRSRVAGAVVLWRVAHGGRRHLALYETFGRQSPILGRRAVDWMLDRSGKTYGKTSYPT